MTNLNQRVLSMGPHFRHVERIERTACGIAVGHDLQVHRPGREFFARDRIEEVSDRVVGILRGQGRGDRRGQVGDSLVRLRSLADGGAIDDTRRLATETLKWYLT
jgi:hypothetical protein